MVTTSTIGSTAQQAAAPARPEAASVVSLIRAGAAQSAGHRERQEDAADIMIPAEPKMAARGSLFVLAEGAGFLSLQNHTGKVVARLVREAFYGSFCSDAGRALRSAFVSTNRTLHKQSTEKLGTARSGALCVAATIQGDKMWLASAGQATVYLLSSRTGVLHKIALGEGPRNDRLGMLPDIEPDLAGPIRLAGGDLLLLSSDGLFGLLPEEIVRHYMTSAMQTTPTMPAAQLAQALVNATRFRDGADNATALVLRCQGVLTAAAAAEYGWPTAYVTSTILPAEGAAEQQPESYTSLATLTAMNLRAPAAPAQPQASIAAGPPPAAPGPVQPEAAEAGAASYTQYEVVAGEATEERTAETGAAQAAPASRLLTFRPRRGKPATPLTATTKPRHDTVDLAALAAARRLQRPPTRMERIEAALARLPGSPRHWQRGAGWVAATLSLAPLVAAPFLEMPYLISAEGLFFLAMAGAGTLCSLDAAIALKNSRTGQAHPGNPGGSASVAAQRLTVLHATAEGGA